MAARGVASKTPGSGRRLATPQSLNAAIKSICDIMRRSNCAGALQYVPELTWILFLRILDEREAREAEAAEAVGAEFTPSLESPHRWRDWAAPDGPKRKELRDGVLGGFLGFVNGDLLPYLRGLKARPGATPRQKVISEIMSGVERTRIDTERNFLDVLDRVHEISGERVDQTHVFTLSQVYEGLLLKMGEKGNDGGQFFTPREVIRAMVRTVDPRVDETVYDPGCGTGGFLAQSYEHMRDALGEAATAEQIETLGRRTFYGREKENLIYPIALANLVLHGIDQPNLQHVMDRLVPGGRCGIVLDEGVLFRTTETAFVRTKRKLLEECDLWCIVSLPAGVFSAAGAGVKTNLLFFTRGQPTEGIWYYDLSDVKVGKKAPFTVDRFEDFLRLRPDRTDSERSWTVSIPERRRKATEEAEPLRRQARAVEQEAARWRERLSEIRKSLPADEARVAEAEARVAALVRETRDLQARADAIEDAVYDLKAVNPYAKSDQDTRTPEELLDLIEAKGREVAAAVAALRRGVVNPQGGCAV